MRFAVEAIKHRADARLLLIQGGRIAHEPFPRLVNVLGRGDLVVVNDAATLPTCLPGFRRSDGQPVELRLAGALSEPTRWRAVLFGRGDWRTRTEDRPAPPPVAAGEALDFRFGLAARVRAVAARSPRFLEIEFEGPAERVLPALYRSGDPVQYSYLSERLASWDQQSVFAGPPVAAEPPSAAFPFTWKMVFALQEKGVGIARLTHAAGLSTTGDAVLDRELPFPERYEIPTETAVAVEETIARGRKVIAIGTTVVRALESSAAKSAAGRVSAGAWIASLKITPPYRRRVVSGILTGMHEAGASHLELLASFVDPALLKKAYAEAEKRGYLWHEYGDSSLIIAGR